MVRTRGAEWNPEPASPDQGLLLSTCEATVLWQSVLSGLMEAGSLLKVSKCGRLFQMLGTTASLEQ